MLTQVILFKRWIGRCYLYWITGQVWIAMSMVCTDYCVAYLVWLVWPMGYITQGMLYCFYRLTRIIGVLGDD